MKHTIDTETILTSILDSIQVINDAVEKICASNIDVEDLSSLWQDFTLALIENEEQINDINTIRHQEPRTLLLRILYAPAKQMAALIETIHFRSFIELYVSLFRQGHEARGPVFSYI